MSFTPRSRTIALLMTLGLWGSLSIGSLALLTPAASAAAGSRVTVRPNPDEQALIAAGATTAPASPTVQPNPDEQVPSLTTSPSPSSEMVPTASAPSSQRVVVRVTRMFSGFKWADAGIGAAGGFGLALLALAGAVTLFQRHRRA